MRRLLDRYVLGIFVPALALFSMTLLFLFIAVDFASKLGKFLEIRDIPLVPFVLRFYLVRIPMLLIILIPSVLLFAPTFTVIKLARSNEILPIAAAGISLRRMSLPFVVAAVLAGLAMAGLDEYILPRLADEISVTEEIMTVRNSNWNVEDYDGETKIWARMWTVADRTLSDLVRITRLDESMQTVQVITAKRVVWNSKLRRWVAYEGIVENPLELVHEPGQKPRTREYPIPPEGIVVESKLSPDTLRRTSGVTARFSFLRLSKLIEEMHRYPHVHSMALRVHSRISFPLSPLVLLLVGLPFVMDPNSKSFIKGLIFCFLLAVGYYLTHFACVDLGNRGAIPPVVGAWLPVSAFGAVGLVAFFRMRT